MLGIVGVITLFILVAPLAVIVRSSAFAKGVGVFLRNLSDPGTLHAMAHHSNGADRVPVNIVFGLAAAWTVTKFDFPGRTLLIALIELPYFRLADRRRRRLSVRLWHPGAVRPATPCAWPEGDVRAARHRAGQHVRDRAYVAAS